MRLKELLIYNTIVIQCHDNPDADAIASGYGLYYFFKKKKKKVRLIYGGKFVISKSNLKLMIEELSIPIEHVEELDPPDLLITVDCQYGESNVTRFEAANIAVIDHHRAFGSLPELSVVNSDMGACVTLVRQLLAKEHIDMNSNEKLATAMYYGLLTDTNNFAELSNPLDKDLRDDAQFNKTSITRFRNSNISIQDLLTAGNALMGCELIHEYNSAIIETEPCDPNILGIISDMLLEVDAIDTCIVYNILMFGVKISVRSCVKEVRANELAAFITEGLGSGGGHVVKAGGFLQKDLLIQNGVEFTKEAINSFLKQRLREYYEGVTIIRFDNYVPPLQKMFRVKRRKVYMGYVHLASIFPVGRDVSIRTLDGDMDVKIHDDAYLMIGSDHYIYLTTRQRIQKGYYITLDDYTFMGEYGAVIRDEASGTTVPVLPYARACNAKGNNVFYAMRLDKRVKVFTKWDNDSYYLGRPGDYLLVREDDMKDIFIVDSKVFPDNFMIYEEE